LKRRKDMSEQTKPKATSEELTTEQLEGVAGGYNPVDGVVKPIKPVVPPVLGDVMVES